MPTPVSLRASATYAPGRTPAGRSGVSGRKMRLAVVTAIRPPSGMGVIVGLLVSSNALFVRQEGWLRYLYLPNADRIPLWVEMAAYTAIGLGTALGGWRIVKTMGSRITKLRPFGGFCAETAGGISILIASVIGVPVSTTHTITGAIVGVGAANRVSAVRWGVATRIVWAWVLTIPMSAAAGMVRIQAQTIRPATPQRTADSRRVEPTPTIAPVMVCVVDTGMPNAVARNSVNDPESSAHTAL